MSHTYLKWPVGGHMLTGLSFELKMGNVRREERETYQEGNEM